LYFDTHIFAPTFLPALLKICMLNKFLKKVLLAIKVAKKALTAAADGEAGFAPVVPRFVRCPSLI